MREDTRRRLERTLLLQRVKLIGGAAAVALGVAGVFWLQDKDASVETRKVAGVVEYVGPPKGQLKPIATTVSVEIDVKLDDGRIAQMLAAKDKSLKIGDRVEIAERVHGTGRHSFSWQ